MLLLQCTDTQARPARSNKGPVKAKAGGVAQSLKLPRRYFDIHRNNVIHLTDTVNTYFDIYRNKVAAIVQSRTLDGRHSHLARPSAALR